MKIKVYVSNGLVGCKKTTIVDIDEDDLSDADLEEIAKEEMFDMIEWGWERVPSLAALSAASGRAPTKGE